MACRTASAFCKDGDILSIDCGVIIDGFYSDAAVTYAIGKPEPRIQKLLDVTKASLEAAIEQCQVGGRSSTSRLPCRRCARPRASASSGSLSVTVSAAACTKTPRSRTLAARGKGPRLKAGMVLAIEPMINAGEPEVKVLKDGWTAVTVDGSYSAHFEHTVAITKDGPLVLTANRIREIRSELGKGLKLGIIRDAACGMPHVHDPVSNGSCVGPALRQFLARVEQDSSKEIVCRRKMQLR